MKLKIKYKMLSDIPMPAIIDKGDWIDLRSATTVELNGPTVPRTKKDADRKVCFTDFFLPLGIAMELPKGFEAIVNPRSSIFKKFKVILVNSQGVIDYSYNGDNDEWMAHIIAYDDIKIRKGERMFQFRIQLSQKATMWQKLKWLFSNGIELIEVDKLGHPDRGGHGTTGVK